MGTKPWMDSAALIESVQRKIALPLNQRTFSEEDVLKFANEEIMLAQVPDILQYHEEYFVYSENILLIANQQRYPIPERAMGMKLRDVYYVDTNGNLFEMTRINPDDKAYWQRESATVNLMQKYYIEGNDIVLAPQNVSSPTGNFKWSYFLRPNQLVAVDRAAVVSSFFTNIGLNSSLMNPGDTLTVFKTVYTAVSGSPSALQFQVVPGNDALTATNLANCINLDATYTASVTNPNIVSIYYTNLNQINTCPTPQVFVDMINSDGTPAKTIQVNITPSNPGSIIVSNQTGVTIPNGVPSNFYKGILVDFLQTRPGHRLYVKDIVLQNISTDILMFNTLDIPLNMVVGDYICEQYECIIPQIPPDFHNGLAERVSARILSAQGDMAGLQIAQAKINDIKKAEGTLIENRVDGSTQKINQRKSCLSFMRMGIRRRI